jgi:uncharacterized protein YecT (DUF1311 family)
MAKAVSTRDIQLCQSAEVATLERRLATIYGQAIATLPADQQRKLREAQRRWVEFRQADCSVFYGNTTGTIATISGGQCMIDRTAVRIKNMQTLLEH